MDVIISLAYQAFENSFTPRLVEIKTREEEWHGSKTCLPCIISKTLLNIDWLCIFVSVCPTEKCRSDKDLKSMERRNKITRDMLQPKVERSFSDEEGSSDYLFDLSDNDSDSSDIGYGLNVCICRKLVWVLAPDFDFVLALYEQQKETFTPRHENTVTWKGSQCCEPVVCLCSK